MDYVACSQCACAVARAEKAEAALVELLQWAECAEVILKNMTRERAGAGRLWGRWQISDEPLRNDAIYVAPRLLKAIGLARDAKEAP